MRTDRFFENTRFASPRRAQNDFWNIQIHIQKGVVATLSWMYLGKNKLQKQLDFSMDQHGQINDFMTLVLLASAGQHVQVVTLYVYGQPKSSCCSVISVAESTLHHGTTIICMPNSQDASSHAHATSATEIST